jgi:hypothetical protein
LPLVHHPQPRQCFTRLPWFITIKSILFGLDACCV